MKSTKHSKENKIYPGGVKVGEGDGGGTMMVDEALMMMMFVQHEHIRSLYQHSAAIMPTLLCVCLCVYVWYKQKTEGGGGQQHMDDGV